MVCVCVLVERTDERTDGLFFLFHTLLLLFIFHQINSPSVRQSVSQSVSQRLIFCFMGSKADVGVFCFYFNASRMTVS